MGCSDLLAGPHEQGIGVMGIMGIMGIGPIPPMVPMPYRLAGGDEIAVAVNLDEGQAKRRTAHRFHKFREDDASHRPHRLMR
jgi:hypothetical protein